ncbi:hypothetical protein [Acaricomes phytoseiuli]|uniref:hypothetical protein n=1 Tax=Acaricomes phytoseiuli TaxID=291968 RepID=UPI0003614098|nr:hypothetical protein [Acaricomes phytoseiuli]
MTSAAQHARTARASQARASGNRLAEPPTEELRVVTASAAAKPLKQHAAAAARGVSAARNVPGRGVPARSSKDRVSGGSRPELSVVPGMPRRKVPFIVFCFAALVSALAIVLVLNISVSANQYQLVALRNQQTDMIKINDQLTQQQQLMQSPQNLAAKARELGMVAPATIGQVNVDTGTIAGNPVPAEKTDSPPPLIGGPQIAGQQNVATQRYGDSNASGNNAGQAPPTGQNLPAGELQGGTIPAPQQRPAQ